METAADRNLHQTVHQERSKVGVMKDLLKQLFEAVAHLQKHKIMYGDLKMLNVVRLRRDNRLRLMTLMQQWNLSQYVIAGNHLLVASYLQQL